MRPSLRSRIALLCPLVFGLACATVSVQDEKQLGQQFEREMRSNVVLVRDPVVNRYVDDIGQRIVSAAGPQPFTFQFHVVDAPEINAFAGPGGQIYVNTETIRKSRDVNELAGVIGHEIGHVVRRHVAQNLERQEAAGTLRQMSVLAGGVLFGQAGAGLANIGGGLASVAVLNSFGREAELEADAFAVEVLPRAGYDPNGLVTFFTMLQREPGGVETASFLSSHPATTERIGSTQALIDAAPRPSGLTQDDGGKLEIIQRRLALITRQSPSPQRGR